MLVRMTARRCEARRVTLMYIMFGVRRGGLLFDTAMQRVLAGKNMHTMATNSKTVSTYAYVGKVMGSDCHARARKCAKVIRMLA